jgi:hypothetical protein
MTTIYTVPTDSRITVVPVVDRIAVVDQDVRRIQAVMIPVNP